MGISKIIVKQDAYTSKVLIDLTSDTVAADALAKGVTAHDKSGNAITGTMENSGGGIDGVFFGSFNQASNVSSSTNVQIAKVSDIGFTPKHFYLWNEKDPSTRYHVHRASFNTFGTRYVRNYSRWNNGSWSTTGDSQSWTTRTAGQLYLSGGVIYLYAGSSYIFTAGTWNYIAVRD